MVLWDLPAQQQVLLGHHLQKIFYQSVVEAAGVGADREHLPALQQQHPAVGRGIAADGHDIHIGTGIGLRENIPRLCQGQKRPLPIVVIPDDPDIAFQHDADKPCRVPLQKHRAALGHRDGSGTQALKHGMQFFPADPGNEGILH